MLHLDYETRSRVDLLKAGAYIYAQDPSTEVICMAYAEDDGPVRLWKPEEPFPGLVYDYFQAGAERSISAHNAQFERLITRYVLGKLVPLAAFYCTAAQARARALPGSLEDLGRALGTSIRKDRRGMQLIRALCIPNRDTGEFSYDRKLLVEMYDYCKRDVEVERLCASATHALTDDEWEDFLVSEAINDRGVRIDRVLARSARNYAKEELGEICAALTALTKGDVSSPRQFARIKEWMVVEAPAACKEMIRYKDGEQKMSFDGAARQNILLRDDLSERAREFVELVDQAGKTSVHKFTAMDLRASESDDRVRGAYMFNGASQTGRFSSHGLQLHNFSRGVADDPVATRRLIQSRQIPEGKVMPTLASMLRPALMAPKGRVLVGGDMASIEARVLPWLAGGEDVLNIYRAVDADSSLPDPYMHAAADIFGVSVEDIDADQRQIGKVAVLSLGYQGGYRAFQAMGRNYGLRVTEAEAERVKMTWRRRNRWCVKYWAAAEKAAKRAVLHPGKAVLCGKIRYLMGDRDLWAVLPDGAALSYPFASIIGGEVVALKASWKPAADATEWPRVGLYGGLLTENVTQAVAARLLKSALRRLGHDVVAHTHDEVILEVPVKRKIAAQEEVMVALSTPPPWAVDLPMAATTWVGGRYQK